MADAPHEVVLSGCTPEPLMNYLKALGVLRLVAEDREHGDPDARGFWRNDMFVLYSRLDEKALEEFFLKHYRPTPIVAPWGGGSGFFKKDNKQAVDALVKSSADRVARYRETIGLVLEIIREEEIGDKPNGEDKVRLIQRYRRELPDEVVSWMDAAMVLQQDGQLFAPLLGTGGNDGRLDFTQNFMQRIVLLRLHEEGSAGQSREWIRQALLAEPARLSSASVGQFAPGRAGGPNATQGMEGDSTDNPWDFVLMMEGSLAVAGAAVRRLGATGNGRAAFPFTVRAVDVGFASVGRDESADSRGELWMPLWDRPASFTELAALFGEGRAEVNGRPPRDAVSFARATATLGVDRGITTFSRVSLLKRSGKAYLAMPAGRIVVREQPHADLLREIDPWLNTFRNAVATSGERENKVKRFVAAERQIDSAAFDFCRYGGPNHFADILIALGRAEREMALTPGKIGQSKSKVSPISGLSAEWIRAASGTAADQPVNRAGLAPEFQIALSLAGIGTSDGEQGRVGPLRANLEPVSTWYDTNDRRVKATWAEKGRAVVWNAADLSTNLAAVLARRVTDGERNGCAHLPLESPHGATPAAISAFLRGEVDERRTEDLLWGLVLVDSRPSASPPVDAASSSLPLVYCLLKPLFLSRGLVNTAGEQDKPRWRLARHDEKDAVRIRPEPRILALLRAERVNEAVRIAMRRLWSSGLTLWCSHVSHTRQCQALRQEWASGKLADLLSFQMGQGRRLAAALLIPVAGGDVRAIVQRATSLQHWTDAIS